MCCSGAARRSVTSLFQGYARGPLNTTLDIEVVKGQLAQLAIKIKRSRLKMRSIRGYVMDWQELSATSHYQTALGIEDELEKGNIQEASAGLKELIEALGRSEKRALKSHLTRLMAHIIK